MRPICLVAILPTLFFGACSLDAKTGCRTADDCAPGRICVAGICQRAGHDAGQDATFDKQSSTDGAIDSTETQSPDLAGGPDGVADLAPQTVDAALAAAATIDARGNSAVGDEAADVPAVAMADAAQEGPAVAMADAAQKAPAVAMADLVPEASVVAINALDGSTGLDASLDKQSSGDVTVDVPESRSPDLESEPDVASDLAATATGVTPDVPLFSGIDTPPVLDSSQGGVDTGSAARDGAGAPTNTWELIGGTPVSGPGATQWGPGQNIDVFWRGTDDHLKHKWFSDTGTWSLEEDLGGTLASEPAATSRTTNMRDVFWRGTDNHLKHRCYSYSEQDLGGALASSPAAASWGALALHVFWQGSDGNLKHKSMDYATDIWTDEIDLGIPVQSDPAALYRNNGVMDVFWRGFNGALQHTWSLDGTNWYVVQDLGGAIAADSSPTATGRRDGWIDVFWKGTDNHLKHIFMNPFSQWSLIEEDLGGDLASSPDATSWDAQRLDVFAKDAPTGQMAHFVWNEDSVVTVNDTDPGITYFGDWTYVSQPGKWDYGDDVHYATTNGSTVEYTFTGTGVDYATEKSFDQGQVDVTIDNVFQQTVSCYGPTGLVPQVAYSNKGLAPGSHTIKISKKDGYFMVLDALRIYR